MLQYPVCYRHDDDNDNAHGREKREGKTRSDPTKDKLTVHPPEGDSSMHERGWQRLEIRRARKGECSLIFGGWRVWDVCGSLIRPLSTKMRILPFPNDGQRHSRRSKGALRSPRAFCSMVSNDASGPLGWGFDILAAWKWHCTECAFFLGVRIYCQEEVENGLRAITVQCALEALLIGRMGLFEADISLDTIFALIGAR